MKLVMVYEDGVAVGPVYELEESDYAAQRSLWDLFLACYPKSLPLGWLLLQRCDDDETWIDREGKPHIVSEIDSGYAANIRRWLERRAKVIHLAAWIRMELDGLHPLIGPRGDHARDSFDYGLESLRDMDAVEFVKTTKLYKALPK